MPHSLGFSSEGTLEVLFHSHSMENTVQGERHGLSGQRCGAMVESGNGGRGVFKERKSKMNGGIFNLHESSSLILGSVVNGTYAGHDIKKPIEAATGGV